MANRNSVKSIMSAVNSGIVPTSGANGLVMKANQGMAYADGVQFQGYPTGGMNGYVQQPQSMAYASAPAPELGLAQILPQMSPVASLYNFSVANTTAGVLTAEIFGTFINSANGVVNFNNPGGITITGGNAPYAQFLQSLGAEPLLIQGIRLNCAVAPTVQFPALNMSTVVRKVTGSTTTNPIVTSIFENPANNNPAILDMSMLLIPVNGEVAIRFSVQPNTTLVFTVGIGSKVSQANALSAVPLLEIGNAPSGAQGLAIVR